MGMPNVKTNLIENHLYGGSVSVAGLLNHQDIESVHLKLNQFCKNILQFWNVLLLELKTQNVEWQ